MFFFFFQAEDGIRDVAVTGVQTCALPISRFSEGDPIWTLPAKRKSASPVRKPYSSGRTGCVSTSTTDLRASESICCRRSDGSSGEREKKKSTRRWRRDRKSTRLNSSHGYISYAVFCLKKK